MRYGLDALSFRGGPALVKDADDGTDALAIPELQRKLTTTCHEYFEQDVRVNRITSSKSHESPLLQLADLLAGSISTISPDAANVNVEESQFQCLPKYAYDRRTKHFQRRFLVSGHNSRQS